MERVKGIEPSSQAWEARILPLNHTRFGRFYTIASIAVCKASLFILAGRVGIPELTAGRGRECGGGSPFQFVDSAD